MSHTNLRTINSTEINNSGAFRVGDNLSSGTTGQVLKSNGDFIAPSWETDIDTTYQGSATIDIDTTTDPDTINVIKVPNTLTFTGYDTGTFDGSSALSINLVDTDTTYQGSATIDIDTTTDPDTINVIKVPNDLTISQNGTIIDTFNGSVVKTIDLEGKYIAGDGIDISGHPIPHIEADTDEITITHNLAGAEKLSVLKVPNTLTFTGYDTGTYDGSSPLTINLTDNQLNLLAGSGIIINNTGGFNRIITADIDNITLGWTPPSPNKQIEVRKVPNALTFTGYSTGTFDGSSPLTINLVDTDTTYQGGTGISINTGTTPHTINASNIPNSALQNSTISGISLGGNLATLTFYDSTGAFITSYNGATPPTSITLDGDTTYQGSATINIDTATTPDTINVIKVPNTLSAGNNLSYSSGTTYDGSVSRTINLDKALTGIDSITMTSTSTATALIGNTYPSNPTDCSYLDLSSTTNIIPGGVLATKIQRTSLIRTCSTSYIELTSNFRTSFKAQSSNVYITLSAILRSDNKVIYGGLYDYNAGAWVANTRTRFCYNDETDQDFGVLTWFMDGLTPGNSYYISPYFRGDSSSIYIIGGSSGAIDGNAPIIMRIYDGGNNVNIY